MPPDSAMEGFWDFSVRTYRTDCVPDACLSLQNDYGADVNMLLYCCWVGAVFGRFDESLYEQSAGFSAMWCEGVVGRLRAARTWMKHDGCFIDAVPTENCMQLREKIKGVEFLAEKMQQEILESLVANERAGSSLSEHMLSAVAANLARYTKSIAIEWDDDVRNKLVIIVTAAFPGFAEDSVREALVM